MKLVASVGTGTVTGFGETVPAVFGKGGTRPATSKREGDGTTPLGVWPIRCALLRPDRVPAPVTVLPWRWLRAEDGWSDDPADPAYNRPVRLPHGFSAETLWREDHVYDVIIILGHNDTPPVAPLGSAIFWHLARPDARATEGCVAVARDVLLRWMARLATGDVMEILA